MPVLCIDFGGTEVKLGILDGPRILATTERPNSGSDADLDHVRQALDELTESAGRSDIAGVGIALPGVVDRANGSLIAAHDKYGYAQGRDLREWAAQSFGVPAVVENDARAALVGETTYGVAAGTHDAVLITLGTGIGTAALIDGQVLRGVHDHAAILGGHVTVALDGPSCNCGNVGCAEAVASTWALQRDVASDPVLAASPLGERAARGAIGLRDLLETRDAPAVGALFDRYLRAWGAAIVTLCHAYDPDIVIVSGGVMRSADVILPPLADYVHAHLWSSSHRPAFVTPSAPEYSVLLGLSALAVNPGDHAATHRKDAQ
ncbi:ROK family protein [Diaminobutyricibacter tongyongensis]|uniref:ROK family protein n=1 Tax=Leifsonia tongyongensis TaxID=1268043 RepID=A0A6L9Y2M4_9MICO|nr:ROK family protein [Diaminobutyricibacter tongyongensis]NEN07909.1 ROK family protein [Diaminobutyricibacter tongyongensis]